MANTDSNENDQDELAATPTQPHIPLRLTEPVDAERPPRLPFPVVGIGASAGGLEAVSEFLAAMRPDSGMAFVVIQHLPPDRPSMMAEIFGKRTKMKVLSVEDGLAVEPDHVYVIRPGFTLFLRDGVFRLGERLHGPGSNRPIDDFFKSLADEQRERGIVIIMSGMGSNGAAGAQGIKAVGGLCIAQEPGSAEFPSMPRHLIEAGYADYILRPAEMPEVLLNYAGHPYTRGAREDQGPGKREEQYIREILAIVRTRTRQDFSGYKKPTLYRRIQRRMGLTQISKLAAYVKLLRQTPGEVVALADDVLIHVTGFFRDSEAWDALRVQVIVPLVASRENNGTLRAWVSACSSGEEAYTLAMLLVEEAERTGKTLDIKVFATDMADRTLQNARSGLYPGGIEREISPERLERFFVKDDELYRVRPDLRERVVFAPQNILQDPPFSRLDIISCRNLLIYLEPEVQQRVIGLLHFGLREGGTLMLGSSETPGTDDLFEPIDKKARLFRRMGPTRHGQVTFPLPHAVAAEGRSDRVGPPESRVVARQTLPQLTMRSLLEHHAPAAVTIDRDYRIVYIHGKVDPFLRIPHGEPTRELMSVVRESVRGAVRTAVRGAMADSVPVTVLDGMIEVEPGKRIRIAVTASPLDLKLAPEYFVISFQERWDAPNEQEASLPEETDTTELRRIRDELQSTIEELQTSNEELKASHEEVVSTNEELQSTNEELETSREEMQSLNEELSTVNGQLHAKMEEYQAVSNDLGSLLTSTDIAVLFLDPRFRIRRFTTPMRDLMEIINSDIGRPFTDLAKKFVDPELIADAETVLARLVPIERLVVAASGRSYMRHALPYRTIDNRIDGVVVTFTDVTKLKRAEESIRESEAWLIGQKEAFQSAIGGQPLAESLGVLLRTALEQIDGDARGAFYMTTSDGEALHLVVGMADAYPQTVNGFKIGPESLACGLAMHSGEPIITPDIDKEPRWKPWRATAHEHDYRGCWSFPIKSEAGPALGTFALYFREPRTPTPRELDLTGKMTHAATIIMSRHHETVVRAAAQAALRDSESLFRTLAETAPALIWQNDAAGNNLFINQQFINYTGKTPQEIVGEGWRTLIHPEDAETYVADYLSAVRNRRPWQSRNRIRRRDGTWRWFENYAQPLFGIKQEYLGHVGVSVDIEDAVVAAAALRDSEAQYHSLFAASPVPFIVLAPNRPDFTITAANEAYLEATLTTRETLIGRRLFDVFTDDRNRPGDHGSDTLLISLNRVLTTKQKDMMPRVRYDIVTPEGGFEPHWWLAINAPVLDAAGQVTAIIHQVTRVTELQLAEEAERKNQERLRDVLNSMAEGFALLNGDFVIIDVNEETIRLDGRSRNELVGRTHWEVFPGTEHSQLGETVRRVSRERVPASLEHEYRWPDGRSMWIDMRAYPTRDAGVAIFWRNVTERKRGEAALRASENLHQAIAANLPNAAVFVFDRDLRYRLAEGQALRHLGRNPADFEGKTLREADPAEIADGKEAFIRGALAGRPFTDEHEVDGRYFISHGVPIPDDGDGISGVVVVSYDITDRRLIEEDLQAAKIAAESASSVKDNFLAMLSHELRTPLSAILLWVKILLGERVTDIKQMRDALEAINRSAESQKELIEDLLDISRITSGQLRLNMREIDLIPVVRDAIDTIAAAAYAKNITIEVDMPDERLVIVADPDRLRQVVWNLLTNSVKFTETQGTVHVAIKQLNSTVEITVRDSGRGISAEFLKHVFELFRQADSSHTRTEGGLGLGLAIVKQLVELHGGTIQAGSGGAGQGSTFTVRLPLRLSKRKPGSRPRSAAAAQGQQRSLAGVKVLLVEDDAATRGAIASLLQAEGMVVYEAETAQTALEAFRSSRPDLLISDIGLPGTDGYALIRHARTYEKTAVLPRVSAIAVTAFARETDRRLAIEAGFDRHIGKPIDPDFLLAVISELSLMK